MVLPVYSSLSAVPRVVERSERPGVVWHLWKILTHEEFFYKDGKELSQRTIKTKMTKITNKFAEEGKRLLWWRIYVMHNGKKELYESIYYTPGTSTKVK